MVNTVKKINRKFLYSFLGMASFFIGLVLAPFSPSNHHGNSPGLDKNIVSADVPDTGPDPDPCPTPDPGPTCQ